MRKIISQLLSKIELFINQIFNFFNTFSESDFNYQYQDDEITLKCEW